MQVSKGEAARSRYKVNKSEALRYLGYSGQTIDESLTGRIDELIAECERLSAPSYVFRTFPVRVEEAVPGGPRIIRLVGSTIVLEGNDIIEHVGAASECAVMACTLGLANEAAMARMKAKSPLDAAVFSAAGSSLVESVADVCEAAIVADAAARGLHANWRYSPGYGDLPLTCQKSIVAALSADKQLGISVTDTDLLVPSKSITALIGLFDSLEGQSGVRKSCKGCACYDCCTLRAAKSPCWKRLREN